MPWNNPQCNIYNCNDLWLGQDMTGRTPNHCLQCTGSSSLHLSLWLQMSCCTSHHTWIQLQCCTNYSEGRGEGGKGDIAISSDETYDKHVLIHVIKSFKYWWVTILRTQWNQLTGLARSTVQLIQQNISKMQARIRNTTDKTFPCNKQELTDCEKLSMMGNQ